MSPLLTLPVLLYLFFSFLYVFAFAARMLESMIEGEIVGISDSLKGLLCFWVFPFGVWQIQPAVQRVLATRQNPTTATNNGL